MAIRKVCTPASFIRTITTSAICTVSKQNPRLRGTFEEKGVFNALCCLDSKTVELTEHLSLSRKNIYAGSIAHVLHFSDATRHEIPRDMRQTAHIHRKGTSAGGSRRQDSELEHVAPIQGTLDQSAPDQATTENNTTQELDASEQNVSSEQEETEEGRTLTVECFPTFNKSTVQQCPFYLSESESDGRFSDAVEQALAQTGFDMYAETPVLHVPPRVLTETFKRTLQLLLNESNGPEAQHECFEHAVLSILLGEMRSVNNKPLLTSHTRQQDKKS